MLISKRLQISRNFCNLYYLTVVYYDMIDEKELLPRILQGDLKAFEILVKQYQGLVFHVVNRIINTKEDKEDICQEVFIKVHQHLHRFEHKSRLSTWIARIAYVTAINYAKKYNNDNMVAHPADIENYSFSGEHPDKLLDKKNVADYINRLIAQMPEQYRTVLTLFHLNEFSYQEIEEITGMPEGTVKSYLFRGRKLLKEKLSVYLKNELS